MSIRAIGVADRWSLNLAGGGASNELICENGIWHVWRLATKNGFLLLLGFTMATSAHAAGPDSQFKRLADEAFSSPDRQVRVEQYSRKSGEFDRVYQFWTFDKARRRGFVLNPGEEDELAGYPAGFRFSPNSQWLVRMQKLGAGTQTLLLYRRNGYRFLPATAKPFGGLAWEYFFGQPVSKEIHRDIRDVDALNHSQVNLLKGLDENYAWLGQHWPDSRYIVISLSFDAQGEDQPLPWVEGWRAASTM